jgi:hypothetical protein
MRYTFGYAIGAAALASAAQAGIVGVGGDAQWIAAPVDARINALTSSEFVRVWNEQQAVAVRAGGLTVDHDGTPGLVNNNSMLSDIVIAAGQIVSSHYIHFDSPGTVSASAKGFVTFDQDIIGVIVRGDRRDDGRNRLDQSDWLSSGTLYSDGVRNRGMELSQGEFFQISPNRRTLAFSFNISNPGDFVRVITVPSPGSAALAVLGGLAIARRRRD